MHKYNNIIKYFRYWITWNIYLFYNLVLHT